MPTEAIFNPYFVEHREWVVRQRYTVAGTIGGGVSVAPEGDISDVHQMQVPPLDCIQPGG